MKGQVVAAKNDGRYRRSLISRGIDTPTSLAVNPIRGEMYWSQAGSNPRIETAWMDGTIPFFPILIILVIMISSRLLDLKCRVQVPGVREYRGLNTYLPLDMAISDSRLLN